MPFENPPDSLTLPADATTGPRIVLGNEIPPEILAYDVNRTWGAVILWYFNDSEYYFIGSGHQENPGPTPDWDFVSKGIYTLADGIVMSEEHTNEGGTPTVYWGNTVMATLFSFLNSEIRIGSDSAIRLPQSVDPLYITRNQVGWGIVGCGLLGGSGVLSSGTEVAIPAANWTTAGGREPSANFRKGRIYRLWLVGEAFNAGGGLSVSHVRIRKGSGTITGTILREWNVERDTNFASVTMDLHCYVKNTTAADIVTALTVTNFKFAGTPNFTIGGPMWLEIEDVGAIGDNIRYEEIATAL